MVGLLATICTTAMQAVYRVHKVPRKQRLPHHFNPAAVNSVSCKCDKIRLSALSALCNTPTKRQWTQKADDGIEGSRRVALTVCVCVCVRTQCSVYIQKVEGKKPRWCTNNPSHDNSTNKTSTRPTTLATATATSTATTATQSGKITIIDFKLICTFSLVQLHFMVRMRV